MKVKFGLLGMLMAALLIVTGLRAEAAPGTDWHNNTITVVGSGVPTPGMHGAQARIMAKRAAIADAYRQLLEIVKGVNVDANTTIEMAMATSDIINLHVQGVIKGATIVSENMTPDGAYEVTMQLPMFGGSGGLADTVMERPARVEPFPQVTTTVTVTINGSYTGLVVDCRGLRVKPVMSPVIKNAKGQKIYGHKNLDPDFVIEHGMASYADSMSQAERAGSNPLVVKAVGVEDFNANPVVSMEDANRILSENQSSGFLDNAAVVFLY